MPIRINLLAEQQAIEEMRRRDPVKRATWFAGFLIGIMVVWSGYQGVKLMGAMREVNRYEAEYKKLEPDYKKVTANMDKIADAQRKWAALESLSTNRFLWATVLNALQYVIASVDDVQVLQLKTDQSYVLTEAIKPSTNSVGNVSRGKPATSREKTLLTIDAKDYSKSPGDRILKFQEAVNGYPYFKSNLDKIELTQRAPVQSDPKNPGKSMVAFTLQCQYPEKVR